MNLTFVVSTSRVATRERVSLATLLAKLVPVSVSRWDARRVSKARVHMMDRIEDLPLPERPISRICPVQSQKRKLSMDAVLTFLSDIPTACYLVVSFELSL